MRAYASFGSLLVLVSMLQHIPEADGMSGGAPKAVLLGGLNHGAGMTPVADDKPKGPATYWVTFSKRIRPGMKLPVTVRLNKPGATSQVSVCLRNGSDHSILFVKAPSATVKADEGSRIIYLEIPKHLERPTWRNRWSYALRVSATGDVAFTEFQDLDLESKYFSVFVQTDKAIYKPGQTVKFRVLAMKPNLTIIHEPMDIFVRDPQGNAMKMWTQVTGYKNTGVVEKKIPTSEQAALGDWELEVTVLNETETKKFTIEEYVLPKFEAILDVPKKVLLSDSAVRGKASAKYTFGKPLTKAEVKVTVKLASFYRRPGLTEPILEKSGNVNKEGEFPFIFYKAEFLKLIKNSSKSLKKMNVTESYLNGRQFKVFLSVKDVQSGKTMETEEQVGFTKMVAKIEKLPITPNTYKPGLKYTAMFKVTKFDDTLFENYENIMVTFNITATYKVAFNETTTTTTTTTTMATPAGSKGNDTKNTRRPKPVDRPWRQRYRYPEEVLGVVIKPLTATGYMTVDADVPFNATRFQIVASVLGQKQYVDGSQSASPSGNYIQIQAQENSPKAGHETSVHVKTTEPVEKLTYQLYAKGVLKEEADATAVDSDRRLFNVTFKVIANMAPNCRVLAFYFRDDGEVVADSMLLKIDTSEQVHVNVSYDKQMVKPGEEVNMKVTTRPNSTVFLMSVDKSVKLLKSGNDITQEMVNEELLRYSYGSGFGFFWRFMSFCGWPWSPFSKDAHGVFNEAKVGIITDGLVYQEERNDRRFLKRGRSGGAEMRSVVFGATNSEKDQEENSEKPAVESVRKFFPETWLFDAVFVGSDGEMLMPQTAPDTITTWMTTAFAVHPQYGLSVIPQAAELTTFRQMFVMLDLPYSAIRGEDLCMKAYVFNYMDSSAYMRLTLGSSKGFANIRLRLRSGKLRQYENNEKASHYVGRVKTNEMVERTFCFTPTSLGALPIRVNLTAGRNQPWDGVERILMVEPEGIPRAHATQVILDVSTQEAFEKEVAIQFPDNTVPGSQIVTVAIAADLLGPVFDNIEDLLRMPYGCGEQNMLYFAPNVFLIEYLKKTDTYTAEVSEKAENYMLTGYQKELKYKHDDGSYSTFGQRPNRTDSGSMWLTAFVTKCFAQSLALGGDVICVDKGLIRQSIWWMVSKQAKNGSFPEPGKVFNKNMQGGSAKGEALTAYVLIALAEANKTMHTNATYDEKMMIMGVVKKAQGYLEKDLTSLTDPYDLAIVTYALHLTHSEKAEEAFRLLLGKAINEPLTMHWERPAKKEKKRHYWYWQRQTDAINIEMTAYALLTLLLRKDMTNAMPVVRWMTQQRGPQGGFISTQDTVIGLQGLAQIAAEIYQPTFTPINVSVHWSTGNSENERTVTLDDMNKLLLHKIELPINDKNEIPTKVTIKATAPDVGNFSGMAVAEVVQDYNVYDKEEGAIYSLKTWVEIINSEKKLLTVEASRVDGKKGSMTVIEVTMPTGYVVDKDDPFYSDHGTSMVEMKKSPERTFVLYYDSLGPTSVRASLPLVVAEGIPVNTDKNVVRVFDYYENDQEETAFFDVTPRRQGICEALPDYGKCRYYQ